MIAKDEREKLMERILKLHRKAESAKEIGSEAEAMIFAETVQKMLLAHDLEISDIEYELERKNDPVKLHEVVIRGKKQSVVWTTLIAKGCAEAHLCDILIIPKSDSILLVGRHQHRMVADFMIRTLVKLGEQLADKAYTKHYYKCQALGDVTLARGFRDGFLKGFGLRVYERYQGMMLETREITKNGAALIRLSSERAAVKKVLQDIEDSGESESSSLEIEDQIKSADLIGLVHGMEAGDNVALRANVLEGKQPAPKHKQLTDGAP